MLNMTFTELQQENTGNADNYISLKEVNENTYINNENKRNNQIFTLKDWGDKSQHFIATHIYDTGHGKFMTLGNLEKEMIRIK